MIKMKVRDFELQQHYSASKQYVRELLFDNFLQGAKVCYKHLGEHIEHACIDLTNLKESDSVEIWQDRIELIKQDGIKIYIERVN